MKREEIAKELKEELNKDRNKSPHTYNEIAMQIRIVKQEWTRQKEFFDKHQKEQYGGVKCCFELRVAKELKDINNALKVLE